MKTFTVRDLDRSPRLVLQACRANGKARIRERSGKTYIIAPETPLEATIKTLPDFAARRARITPRILSKGFAQKLNKALAGE